jgi:hypothetical protein
MYRSRSIIALGVLVCFLGLFQSRACVGESLDPVLASLFLYALILLLLARNAFICVHYFQWLKFWLLAVLRGCPWSGGPVGIV